MFVAHLYFLFKTMTDIFNTDEFIDFRNAKTVYFSLIFVNKAHKAIETMKLKKIYTFFAE